MPAAVAAVPGLSENLRLQERVAQLVHTDVEKGYIDFKKFE